MKTLSTGMLAALIIAVPAFALSLAGAWKRAGALAEGLFFLTLVLALVSLINESDRSAR